MGTEFQVILCGEDPDYLRDAAEQALDEIERVEAQLSHYRPDSDITDLNLRAAYGPVRLEPLLFGLLERARGLAELSGGAFDPTCGALIRCWGFYRGQGAPANETAVAAALHRTGFQQLELEPAGCTVHFRVEGLEVHLGALGKGYALDRAAAELRTAGVEAALLHGGTSSVYAVGAPPAAPGWEVGLCDPDDRARRIGTLLLRDQALSTSGDYEQFFEIAGERYSHILDPRTGLPARGTRSATVVAPSAADTDALSTAAFVLGVEGTRRLREQVPGFAALLMPEEAGGKKLQPVLLGDIPVELS